MSFNKEKTNDKGSHSSNFLVIARDAEAIVGAKSGDLLACVLVS